MNDTLEEFSLDALDDNVFNRIGEGWMLITAGGEAGFNMMTASWGGLGVLWGRQVVFCFVRPSRYTFGFMEKAGHFSLSFFAEEYRKDLSFCGEHSGREVDKAAETGLSPVFDPSGAVYFSQADLVLISRKIYYQDIDPAHFLDETIVENYLNGDFHRMYIGEILRSLRK